MALSPLTQNLLMGPPRSRQGSVSQPKKNPIDTFLQTPGGSFLMNILAQSGYSPVPQSEFGAIGRAALMTQQQGRQRRFDALQQDLLRAQIGLTDSRAQQQELNPSAANVQSQFITDEGKLGYLRRNGEVVITDQDVKESYSIRTLADGSQIAVNNADPQDIAPVISEKDARDASIRKQQTQEQAEAITELPRAVGKAENALNVLDQMEGHPGFSGAVGLKGFSQFGGVLPSPLAGTPEADFIALVNQASGAVFLEAFQELKGGGHITEIEGQKAEQAVARIGNVDQSESGYKEAIKELRGIIQRGMERKSKAASGDFSVPKQETDSIPEGATATNPQTGERIIYRGGQWVPFDG